MLVQKKKLIHTHLYYPQSKIKLTVQQIQLVYFNILLMNSQSTHNLIGFLAKKSLFKVQNKPKQTNNTDIKSVSEAISRSITQNTKNQSKSQISQFNVFQDTAQRQLYKKGVSEIQKSSPKVMSHIKIGPRQQNRFEKIKPKQTYISHVKQKTERLNSQNPQSQNTVKCNTEKNRDIFMGFKPSSKKEIKAFETLQYDSSKYLESLSARLNDQISMINSTVQIFNAKVFKLLNSQIESLKVKILKMVDEMVQQTQKNLITYIKQQQKHLLNQVVSIKEQLQNQHRKVQQMKVTIKTNEWRKTAAQLIASDLETHVDSLIGKTRKINLKLPELNQQRKYERISQLSNLLKEVFHVQEWEKRREHDLC